MSNKLIQKIVLFTVFLIIVVLSFWMVFPFLLTLFWSGVLASIFYPTYKRILAKTKRQSLSATITLAIIVLVVILPFVFSVGIVINEAVDLYTVLNNRDKILDTKIAENLSNLPSVLSSFENLKIEEEIAKATSTGISLLLGRLSLWTQNIVVVVLNMFVMLYVVYYFLRDGKRFSNYLLKTIPLKKGVAKEFAQSFVSTSKATLKGTILLGFIQGVLGGITLFVVGIQSVLLLTLVMIILSIIPAVGPMFVLLPATLYFAFLGELWQVVVLVVGMVVVSLSDNLLRPTLVGKDLKMHPLIIFLSTIGGLGLFGISGVVIGPIIAVLLVSILEIYESEKKGNV